MNTIEITGRLVRPIEILHNRKTGKPIVTRQGRVLVGSSIADQHSQKEGDVSFFRFVMYGDAGEQAMNQFGKGDLVFVKGWMKQNRWKASDGTNRNDWELRVQEIYPVEKKSEYAPESNDDKPAWIEEEA